MIESLLTVGHLGAGFLLCDCSVLWEQRPPINLRVYNYSPGPVHIIHSSSPWNISPYFQHKTVLSKNLSRSVMCGSFEGFFSVVQSIWDALPYTLCLSFFLHVIPSLKQPLAFTQSYLGRFSWEKLFTYALFNGVSPFLLKTERSSEQNSTLLWNA